MNPLEICANAFNLVSVFLANRNKVHTWWVGIIGTVLFGVLFIQVNLYADATLQLFFIGTSILGWRNWTSRANRDQLPISRTSLRRLTGYTVLAVLVLLGYGYLLSAFTDASYPFIDSVVLVFSVVAQLLLMERKLETWVFWIIVDLVAVPLFTAKELYLTAIIYFAFLINAAVGLWNWHRIYRSQK